MSNDSKEMPLSIAIATILIAFLVSIFIIKLATIIVPGLPFWPAMGILWLVKFFY